MPVQEYEHHYLHRQVKLEYFYAPVSGQVPLDSMPAQEYEHHYLLRQVN